MYRALRPLLFALDPEASHELTLRSLAVAGETGLLNCLGRRVAADSVTLMGLEFPNRVGLAAGLDKNAECVRAFQGLGFGFIEVGTVTPLAQTGNPRPRMFRLPEYEAIINRMGFNNHGLDVVLGNVARARQRGLRVPLGINIGKNKATPAERAVDDYLCCMQAAYPLADYITVNLSSPNTPGLRDLQFGEALDALLDALREKRESLADTQQRRVPLLVKIAPDMASDDLLSVADRLHHYGIDGVIATNTTVSRDLVANSPHASEAGGLSGAVLFEASTRVVRQLADHLQGAMTIIGVGGISSGETALQKLEAGADLVQLYSGLVYRGPGLVREVANAIAGYHPDRKDQA